MKTTHLSIKELAAFIGVSTDTIRRAVRRGEIPATRVSPHVYAAERRGQPAPVWYHGGTTHRDRYRRSKEFRSSPFTLTIDWLAFTLPSGSVNDTMEILGGD